ncbi:MAG: DNA polymerase III subunit alpha [Elusimicrobia bacterium]|nr:DNA polymerase III subunit alpha [Elusimicrobiota bacterium]
MSDRPEFIHLHNHSEYSLLDGITRFTDHDGNPSEILKHLARAGARGLAITDHGNLYGAIEFYSQCNAVGLKPILGCEMYLAKGSRTDRAGSQKENCHLTVLAMNNQGYQNLLSLSSRAFLEGFYYDPRIDKELLARHAKGLIVLSGCLKSEISQLILSGNLKAATDLAVHYRDLLDPDCFYLEIMDHGLEKQRQVLQGLLEIHKRTQIPLVATNDCHYPEPSDWDAHDARICISTGRQIEDANRLRFESHEFYLKTAEEMAKIFHFAPEALSNTLKIGEMCRVAIDMKQLYLPRYEVPEGRTQDSYLEELCRQGLERLGRAGDSRYRERLDYELSVIRRMGFSGYFLIVWDFIRYAKSQAIPVGPGRGSGAGALVSYSLDITTIDPIQHNLLFERFLNPDRRSMPDLDIDFSDEGRERVIEYVRK